MSLSFIVSRNEFGKNKVVGGVEGTETDELVWERIEKEQAARGSKVKEYKFDMKQVEAFRYRMEDALRAVTRSAIKEARVKELKQEILNSDKLKVDSLACTLLILVDVYFFVRRLISKTTPSISSTSATTSLFTRLESNRT